MRLQLRQSILVLAWALLAFACAKQAAQRIPATEEGLVYAGEAARVAAVTAAAEPAAQAAQQPAPAPPSRKLIRNAYLQIEVPSVLEAVASIRSLVEAAGGYVGDESQSEDGYGVKSASLSCRVPADELDRLLQSAQEQGKVESVRITAQDITEQYFDLEIRLGTEKRLESRLLELLDRRSNELKDLLEIERELARVRGQIDQMEGRRRFWDHQVAMATLHVDLHEPRPAIAGREGGALRTLLRSFRQAGENFVLAIAYIISSLGALIPVGAVLAAAVWLVLRLRRRRRGSSKAAPPAQGGES